MKYVLKIKKIVVRFSSLVTHTFNHGNIIKFCARPWETKEEMTEGYD